MRSLSLLVAAIYVGSTVATSEPYLKCKRSSENEVLRRTPPCCEATCFEDCSTTVCPQMTVFKPTFVCREKYVRHMGDCIPKEDCPPGSWTTVNETTTSTTAHPCATGTKTRRPRYRYVKGIRYTIPPPTTTTPSPLADMPPPKCLPCERLVFAQSCCEPSCDYDCSRSSCPLVLVNEPICACQPGLVRHRGHCIPPSSCPGLMPHYQLYAPVGSVLMKCDQCDSLHGTLLSTT